jgi:hypothetical protein
MVFFILIASKLYRLVHRLVPDDSALLNFHLRDVYVRTWWYWPIDNENLGSIPSPAEKFHLFKMFLKNGEINWDSIHILQKNSLGILFSEPKFDERMATIL